MNCTILLRSAAVALAALAGTAPAAVAQSLLISHYDSPAHMELRNAVGSVLASNAGGPGDAYIGAAFDDSGNWITSRRSPSRVEKFAATGQPLGGFDAPEVDGAASDVSVFADGTVAVCNFGGSGGVHLYSPVGAYLGSFPAGANVWSSTVDGLDRLWVIDLTQWPGNPGPSTLLTFDRTGVLLQTLVLGFRAGDLVVAPGGDLWIVDFAGRVEHRTGAGALLASFSLGVAEGTWGLARMDDGSLWIAHYVQSQLLHVSAQGAALGTMPSTYFGPLLLKASNCGEVASYCTAGTTTNGCLASISASGTPDANAGSGFTITVSSVEGQRQGILFYGITGAQNQPWASGSTSTLCVKSPQQRTVAQNSGGTAGTCQGTLAIDWNAYVAAHPGALGSPFAFGQPVFAQGWFRDPAAVKTTSLSDALRFTICP